MEFTFDAAALQGAAAWAATALPKRPSIPVLSGMLVTAGDGFARLSCFDYETSAAADAVAVRAGKGAPRVLVSGPVLAAIVKALPPAKPVTLSWDKGDRVAVTCGATRYQLLTFPVEEYPELPPIPDGAAGVIAGDLLAEAVGRVAPAASNDDSTPALTCVRMEFGVTSPDVVSFAATDRYRCAAADVLWQPDAMDTPPASLPAAVLERLVRAVPADEKVTIAVGRAGGDAQLVAFHYPGRQLTTRTLSAQFPAVWRQLVNPQLAATAVTGAADMAAALHRAQIVLDTRGAAVTLEFTAAGAALSADAGDAAAVTDHVDASLDGENWAVQVNPAYLADAVKACNTDKVRIGYERPGKAVLITPISHDGTPVTTYGHIVMPLGKGK